MVDIHKSLGVAVVGYGYWGPNLARNFHQLPDAELTYIVDVDQAVLTRAGRLFGCKTSTSLDEVLADPAVEAVVVATPARTHYELARRAIEAGKHVLVEKPLTMDLDQGYHLVELAAAQHVTLMVGHVFEYNAAVRYIKIGD